MGFQDIKKHENVEEEKAHLLRLGVPFYFAWKVPVHPYGKLLLDIQLFWPRDPGKSRIRWP